MHKDLDRAIENLATTLVQKAIATKITITTAESCTGGLLSGAITNISGSSNVFSYGFVTYANEAKTKMLGVSKDTLKQYGAVSEETAAAMATGALSVANADIAVSVTGIAGPTGGSATKPVGLVYISTATKKEIITKRFVFDGNRHQIRLQTVYEGLTMLLSREI